MPIEQSEGASMEAQAGPEQVAEEPTLEEEGERIAADLRDLVARVESLQKRLRNE